MNPVFLSLEDVLELHEDQINRYGGSHGTRDMGLLLSAVEMPRASFGDEFLHTNLYEMASAYLFHLVQNHPFIDGNKRVGLAACIAFLGLNNIKLVAADVDNLTNMVLDVAQGKLGKAAIAKFLKKNSQGDHD